MTKRKTSSTTSNEVCAEERLEDCLEEKIRRVYALIYAVDEIVAGANTDDRVARSCVNELIVMANEAAKDLHDAYQTGVR